jgi:hypothetical protein
VRLNPRTSIAVLLALFGSLIMAPKAIAQCDDQTAASQLLPLLNNVPTTTSSYNVRDSQGDPTDTIKIIADPAGGYIGVYHSNIGGEFYVRVATSPSPLSGWSYAATLASNASQPTIAHLSNGGFLVALEKFVPNVLDSTGLQNELDQPGGTSHLQFLFYPDISHLVTGHATQTFNAPHTLSNEYEGTPSLGAISVGPPTSMLGVITGAPLSNSTINVGFHYYDTSIGLDRQATGVLTNFSSWSTQSNTTLNNAFPSSYDIGGRDYLSFADCPFTLIEAQSAFGDFSTWRIYLYDNTAGTLTKLSPDPAGGAVSLGNPKVTALPDGSNQALVVSLFVFTPGNNSTTPGPLVYYNDF